MLRVVYIVRKLLMHTRHTCTRYAFFATVYVMQVHTRKKNKTRDNDEQNAIRLRKREGMIAACNCTTCCMHTNT